MNTSLGWKELLEASFIKALSLLCPLVFLWRGIGSMGALLYLLYSPFSYLVSLAPQNVEV